MHPNQGRDTSHSDLLAAHEQVVAAARRRPFHRE
jgi:hypothetical protein